MAGDQRENVVITFEIIRDGIIRRIVVAEVIEVDLSRVDRAARVARREPHTHHQHGPAEIEHHVARDGFRRSGRNRRRPISITRIVQQTAERGLTF